MKNKRKTGKEEMPPKEMKERAQERNMHHRTCCGTMPSHSTEQKEVWAVQGVRERARAGRADTERDTRGAREACTGGGRVLRVQ